MTTATEYYRMVVKQTSSLMPVTVDPAAQNVLQDKFAIAASASNHTVRNVFSFQDSNGFPVFFYGNEYCFVSVRLSVSILHLF